MNTITLRSGHEMPQIGFGTFQLEGDSCTNAVRHAIELGYRQIDTAFAYGNHHEVAAGIRLAGINRKDLFVTTKIPLQQPRRDQVIQFGQKLQQQLDMEYVDLLLIHWPSKKIDFAETLGAMGELVSRGRVRSIGISNFNRAITAEADEASPLPVVTNQVEFHPYLYQKSLLETCRDRGIALTAYSPLARGRLLGDSRLAEIAEQHGATTAQVALAWAMQKGIVVIPKASGRDHIESNLRAGGITLTADEIDRIDRFEENIRTVDGSWKHYPFD